MNRYILTDQVKNRYEGTIKKFISDMEKTEDLEVLVLSDSQLNPYTLGKILENLGYQKDETDTNGWEMDFDISYVKKGSKTLLLRGCGMTFELKLTLRLY